VIYNPYYANSGYPHHPNTMNYPNPMGSNPMQGNWPKPTTEHCSDEVVRPQGNPHAMKEEIVYVEAGPVKSSTVQDYELYLMEKEYYPKAGMQKHGHMEKGHHHKEGMQQHAHMEKGHHHKEGMQQHAHMDMKKDMQLTTKITCENLPIATAFVRPQPFQNLNSPAETLQQGTLFNDLYQPYVARKVAQGGRC